MSITPEQAMSWEAQLERLRKHAADTSEYATRYTNLVIAAGFAAFFAVWSAFIPHLPRWATLLTGSLIGAALILFIAWTVYQAWENGLSAKRTAAALLGATQQNFSARWDAVTKAERLAILRIYTLWPWIFLPTVALGLSAAVLLAGFGLFGAAGLLTPAVAPACLKSVVVSPATHVARPEKVP